MGTTVRSHKEEWRTASWTFGGLAVAGYLVSSIITALPLSSTPTVTHNVGLRFGLTELLFVVTAVAYLLAAQCASRKAKVVGWIEMLVALCLAIIYFAGLGNTVITIHDLGNLITRLVMFGLVCGPLVYLNARYVRA